MAVNSILRAFAPAAKVTLPVGTGYLFLGAAYGIYMHVNGFSVWYPALMAWLIYGGSLEFVAASMLLSPFAPVTTFFVAFMIQARHLFYGLAMLDRFKGLGWKKLYLIFGMSDESFALEFATKAPEGGRLQLVHDVDHVPRPHVLAWRRGAWGDAWQLPHL